MQDPPENWAQAALQFQQALGESWGKALQALPLIEREESNLLATELKPPHVTFDPEKVKALQQEYVQSVAELWQQTLTANPLVSGDKRFAGQAWANNPLAAF